MVAIQQARPEQNKSRQRHLETQVEAYTTQGHILPASQIDLTRSEPLARDRGIAGLFSRGTGVQVHQNVGNDQE